MKEEITNMDIPIGDERWIKWIDISNEVKPEPIDQFLFPLTDLFARLQTKCIPECCGIDAYSFEPNTINQAVENLDKGIVLENLYRLKKGIIEIKQKAVISSKLNNLFDKEVFIQLIDHIIDQIEEKLK